MRVIVELLICGDAENGGLSRIGEAGPKRGMVLLGLANGMVFVVA